MKIRPLTILVLLMTVIITYTTTSYLRSAPQIKENVTVQDQDQKTKDVLNTYRINMAIGIKSNGTSLKKMEFRDSAGKVGIFEDVLKERKHPILVYRFSEYNCASCVNSALKIYKKWEPSFAKENTIILGAYKNNKVFKRTIKAYEIKHSTVYNTPSFKMFAEELDYPYFFLLDNQGTISNVFVPDKATPDITDEYLTMLHQRYFAN